MRRHILGTIAQCLEAITMTLCEGCKMEFGDNPEVEENSLRNSKLWHTECWKIYANTCRAIKDERERARKCNIK